MASLDEITLGNVFGFVISKLVNGAKQSFYEMVAGCVDCGAEAAKYNFFNGYPLKRKDYGERGI